MGTAPVGTIDALNYDFPLGNGGFPPFYYACPYWECRIFCLLGKVFRFQEKPPATDHKILLILSIHVNSPLALCRPPCYPFPHPKGRLRHPQQQGGQRE